MKPVKGFRSSRRVVEQQGEPLGVPEKLAPKFQEQFLARVGAQQRNRHSLKLGQQCDGHQEPHREQQSGGVRRPGQGRYNPAERDQEMRERERPDPSIHGDLERQGRQQRQGRRQQAEQTEPENVPPEWFRQAQKPPIKRQVVL